MFQRLLLGMVSAFKCCLSAGLKDVLLDSLLCDILRVFYSRLDTYSMNCVSFRDGKVDTRSSGGGEARTEMPPPSPASSVASDQSSASLPASLSEPCPLSVRHSVDINRCCISQTGRSVRCSRTSCLPPGLASSIINFIFTDFDDCC